MNNKSNTFRTLLETTDDFIITCEHIPGRFSRDKKLDGIVEFARKGKESGLVHAISLTDNPGGTPSINPDVIAAEIEAAGLPAIVHFTAKDMNRNMIEARALSLDRQGIRNVLVMSGDYQTMGLAGLSMPVFDLDPVHILATIDGMNRGRRITYGKHEIEECEPTDFYPGAVVSPFKFTEAGFNLQLYKMEKKYRAGARYFITQLGFDATRWEELLAGMREMDINVPMFGSVFILRRGAARVMHRGDIPGSFVTDDLLDAISAEAGADDKGRAASLERAAMQVAVLMGLGFRGAHIEAMILKFDMIETIVGRARELKDSWRECAEKLSYAPSGSYTRGIERVTASSPATKKMKSGWLLYRTMRVMHDLFFVKKGALSPMMRWSCRLMGNHAWLNAFGHRAERAVKGALFECQDCGDCALPELQFLCPQSQCPKQERNGPCGGSRLDACEVYPEKPCVWHRVYARSKTFNELDDLRETVIGPRDWDLWKTSGWVNFHLDRDHTSYDFLGLLKPKTIENPPPETDDK